MQPLPAWQLLLQLRVAATLQFHRSSPMLWECGLRMYGADGGAHLLSTVYPVRQSTQLPGLKLFRLTLNMWLAQSKIGVGLLCVVLRPRACDYFANPEHVRTSQPSSSMPMAATVVYQ